MAEIADRALVRRASIKDATDARALFGATSPLVPLTSIAADQWRQLSEAACEPNGYYLPGWQLAVNAFACGRTDASAIAAWNGDRLIGLMPLVSMWRAYKIPLPALVSAHPYGTLCTPLLDRTMATEAATQLLQSGRDAGAHALVLRDMSLDGAVMKSFAEALKRDGIEPRVLQSVSRACLDATRDADELLHEALGAKKLKELRRQRHRLAANGEVRFDVARSPEEVAAALEIFLALEASGWKGARRTALIQNNGDARFIRHATSALAASGQCEIVTLRAGDTPVAAGIVLRHQDRAFFFKIGIDERFAKFSPGVQLTLDLTRHLCADPAIASADSTASPDHPMINPIWRGRFAIGDVLIPLRAGDPVASLVHAAMMLRHTARAQARRAIQLIRKLKSK
ncbi:MAG: GNAT family N-acetyltransferase [Bradyrhizobium sp.]|uniref:GNAT family N-acetyltransferase n=1 Tax=Bradyrhizobium sp. TaxID=376 RepID=UPI001C299B8C|nr:GNAT family N-acetyltransferase [Bradyrhizobium sp.]MBU6462257.1 GNAT family N-acetyltransferase [Pseudomonadota bacterium]MDE2067310.1 GNAT family N-acetyltransferase [Bradyrhizobium sp.]MDE2243285.1 GNAT family N-acetyltransferase [Bradyrhizobium sp.]MDE2471939.1 GNAT family N-acetyltransferase [Bradyrhizobium sp.]